MNVGQLRDMLSKFDDKTIVVVNVETQLGQDEDYEVITDYSNVARTLRTPFLNFDIWHGYKELDNIIKTQKKRKQL